MTLFPTFRRNVLKVEVEITPETPTVHLTATRCLHPKIFACIARNPTCTGYNDRLWDGRFGVRIRAEQRDLFLLDKVHTGSEAHTVF